MVSRSVDYGMDAVRALVEELLEQERLPSRNRSFGAYEDAQFAHAARVVRQIRNVRADLALLDAEGRRAELTASTDDGEETYLVTYRVDPPQGPMTRTAHFSRWELELLCRDEVAARVLGRERAA